MAKVEQENEAPVPDAFQVVGGEASSWMMKHERKIIIGAAAIVLLAGGAAVVSYLGDRAQGKASQALGTSLKTIAAPIAGSPEAEMAPPDELTYPTLQARDEATVESMAAFRNEFSGTLSAKTATVAEAQALYRLGRHAEAQKAFESFLSSAAKGSPMRLSAIEGLGYSYEAQGQKDAALKAFADLQSEATGAFLVGMGDFHRARILATEGKLDEAAKAFRAVADAHPGTAAGRLAEERLTLLAAQGVAVPAAAAAPAPEAAPAEAGN